MVRLAAQKHPWLAAVPSVVATGPGHRVLRRRKRAVGRLAPLSVTASAFLDRHAFSSPVTGGHSCNRCSASLRPPTRTERTDDGWGQP